MGGEAKPLPPPRSQYHAERIRDVFTQLDVNGKGILSFDEIRLGLEREGFDWSLANLDGKKVTRAIALEASSAGHETVDFDAFWEFCIMSGEKPGVDPVLDAHAYLTEHKVVAIVEGMTAALMVAKPEDVKPFLVERLERLKASGTPVNHFTDEDLATMFDVFDVSRHGAITAAQCNRALKALTGRDGEVRGGVDESVATVTMRAFIKHARAALDDHCS